MKKDKFEGYVKKETMYMVIGVALLVGFLSGVVFTVFKAPGGDSASSPQVSQNQSGGHDLSVAEKQVADTPNDPEAWTHLGNAYFDSDQPKKAIKAYTKSLELAPGNPNVLTDLGVMYRRSGEPDKALASFDKAIAASPTHEQSRLNKGVVLMFDKQDQAAAFKAWEELLAMNPMVKIPNGQLLKDFMQELQKNSQ